MTTVVAPGNKRVWVVDCEVFSNYFLAVFYNGSEYREYTGDNLSELGKMLNARELVLASFNGFDYDDCLLKLINTDKSVDTDKLWRMSHMLINCPSEQAVFKLKYAPTPWAYSIDIFQMLNKKGSLKEWECRIGFEHVADTPVDFTQPLDPSKIDLVKAYCRNDAKATWALLQKNWHLVVLREKLNKLFDLGDGIYRMSEQGVAQHAFLTFHRLRTGERSSEVKTAMMCNPINSQFSFPLPTLVSKKVRFSTSAFQQFFDTFLRGSVCTTDGHSWQLGNDSVDYSSPIVLADTPLSFGVGGLHSVDGPLIIEDSEYELIDLDVVSYYPSIIINERLYPPQLGPSFIDDMVLLRDTRIKAKRNGDKHTSDALKICINATFGKLNDAWSPLRSVDNAHRVTINGQLFILMLLESLHCAGAKILSANTDGITIAWKRGLSKDALTSAATWWQSETGFELETTYYKRIYRRDVNSYFAVGDNGKIKYKGAINPDSGKGDGVIIKRAAESYLISGIDPAITIANERSLTPFLFYARCKNGGVLCFDRQTIGKTCRWYASVMGGKIERRNPPKNKVQWAKLPHGDSASLANDLTTCTRFEDLDRDYYVEEAWKLIKSMSPESSCLGPQVSTPLTEPSTGESSCLVMDVSTLM